MLRAILALLIFITFFILHRRIEPFIYRFQNKLDGTLFVADMLIVFFGLLYTASGASKLVEVLILLLIIGSVVVTMCYLVYRTCGQSGESNAKVVSPAPSRANFVRRTTTSPCRRVARPRLFPLSGTTRTLLVDSVLGKAAFSGATAAFLLPYDISCRFDGRKSQAGSSEALVAASRRRGSDTKARRTSLARPNG